MSDKNKEAVLNFWGNIEQYMLPITDSKYEKSIYERDDGSLDTITSYLSLKDRRAAFPWEKSEFEDFISGDKEYTWEHQVFIGGLNIHDIYDFLTSKKTTYNTEKTTFSASFVVDAEGRFFIRTFDRAAFLDDVSLRKGLLITNRENLKLGIRDFVTEDAAKVRQNLSIGIEMLKQKQKEDYDEYLQLEIEKQQTLWSRLALTSDILSRNDYTTFISKIINEVRGLGFDMSWDIKVQSTPVLYEFSNSPSSLILSSFHLEALKKAEHIVRSGQLANYPLLNDYLTPSHYHVNIDSEEYKESCENNPVVTPSNVSDSQRALNNLIFCKKSSPLSSNIIAVNGPPGTGKTSSILNAFFHMSYLQTKILQKDINQFSLELSAYEKMLGLFVLSSNNEAVNNVVNGLTSKNIQFLSTVARKVDKNNLLGIPLGKKSNINNWLSMSIDKKQTNILHNNMPIIYPNDFQGFMDYNRDLLLDPKFKGETLYNYFHRVLSLDQDSILRYIKEKLMEFNNLQPELDAEKIIEIVFNIREALVAMHAHRYLEIIVASSVIGELSLTVNNNVYWRLLHPLMSSTLASSSLILNEGMFELNSIPLIFIDEAAQIPPQHVINPLLFARRLVVSGDPMQTDKINSSSDDIMHLFYKESIAKDKSNVQYLNWFYPSKCSVQTIADRVSTVGFEDDMHRIGFPLREHFRCHNEIFDFVNAYAYNNRLIYKTLNNRAESPYQKGSTWIHTPFNKQLKTNSRVQLDELQVMDAILSDIENNTTKYLHQKIFIMTAFNDIKNELYRHLYGRIKRLNKTEKISITIDTVHGFQGKECDIVYFVLGGKNLDDKMGGFFYSPNVLNVAVSRAKNYFFMVGDRNMARKFNGLGLLARTLDFIGHNDLYSMLFKSINHDTKNTYNNIDSEQYPSSPI